MAVGHGISEVMPEVRLTWSFASAEARDLGVDLERLALPTFKEKYEQGTQHKQHFPSNRLYDPNKWSHQLPKIKAGFHSELNRVPGLDVQKNTTGKPHRFFISAKNAAVSDDFPLEMKNCKAKPLPY